MNYNLAQSWLFYEIAPVYRVIIWRNRIFLLTLRQIIKNGDMEKWFGHIMDAKEVDQLQRWITQPRNPQDADFSLLS